MSFVTKGNSISYKVSRMIESSGQLTKADLTDYTLTVRVVDKATNEITTIEQVITDPDSDGTSFDVLITPVETDTLEAGEHYLVVNRLAEASSGYIKDLDFVIEIGESHFD